MQDSFHPPPLRRHRALGKKESSSSYHTEDDDDDYTDNNKKKKKKKRGKKQPASKSATTTTTGSLQTVLKRHSELTLLVQALDVTNLWSWLALDREWTIFAPTNAALEAAWKDQGGDLWNAILRHDPDSATSIATLRHWLLVHLIPDHVVVLDDLPVSSQIVLDTAWVTHDILPTTLTLQINPFGTALVWVNDDQDENEGKQQTAAAKVLQPDLRACNGVVHVLDQVLVPHNNGNGKVPSSLPRTVPKPTPAPTLRITPQPTTTMPISSVPVAPPTLRPTTSSPSPSPTPLVDTQTIAQFISHNPERYSLLEQALFQTNVWTVLNDTFADLTLLAPTNAAWNQSLSTYQLEFLSNNTDMMRRVLLYHVVQGIVTRDDLIAQAWSLTPLDNLLLSNQTILVLVDDAPENSDYDLVVLLLGLANSNVEDPPQVVQANQVASNGLIHDVHQVLLPRLPVAATVALQEFTILYQVLQDLDLVELLNNDDMDSEQEFTLFAPTDQAFGAIRPDVWDFLQAPQQVDLWRSIILYHVLPQRFTRSQLRNYPPEWSLRTLQAQGLQVELLDDDDNDEPPGLVIRGNNNPRDTSPPSRDEEYLATNGLVHAVDQVLLPTLSIGHQLVFTGGFSILLSVLDQTNLLTTLMNNRLQLLTLLAPTDAAFGALGTRALTYLTERVELLEFVLLYHILDRVSTRNDLLPTDGSNSTVVRNTLNSQFLRIVVTNETTTTEDNSNKTLSELTVVVQGNPFRTSVVEPAQIIPPFDVFAVN